MQGMWKQKKIDLSYCFSHGQGESISKESESFPYEFLIVY